VKGEITYDDENLRVYEIITNDDVFKENYNKITIKYNENDLIPIYIVNSYTYTFFGKGVRKFTHDAYTHSAISLDSSLNTLYSFNGANDKGYRGFSIESLKGYIQVSPLAEIYVGTLILTNNEYNIIKDHLNRLLENADKTSYAFSNIFNIVINRQSKENEFRMVCSQFVNSLLKFINVDASNKASSLTRPEDLRYSLNKRIFKVFEGYATDYDYRQTNRFVDKLKLMMRGKR